MELNEDGLNWTSACENEVFDTEGLDDLIEKLDLVLRRMMQAPNESAIELIEGGVVICGLPAFQLSKSEAAENHSTRDSLFDTFHFEEEWTLTESIIRKVLSEVSHTPEGEITKSQTIFNLGLDSILAIKVSSLLGKRSISLSVGEMLKAATIMNMAQLVDAKRKDFVLVKKDTKTPLIHLLGHIPVQKAMKNAAIDLAEAHMILPCSPGQVYMLSAWQNSEGAEFYSTFELTTSKKLDKMRLDQAWSTLCEQSSILKTRFASTGDRQIPFLQVVLRHSKTSIVWLSQPPFDGQLNTDFSQPLVSLTVVLPNSNTSSCIATTSLFLKIHHALYDGVSLDILVQQLQSLYQDPNTLLDIEPEFDDFLAQELTSSSQTSRKEFWSMYLSRSENILLPLGDPSPGYSKYERKCLYTPRLVESSTSLSMVARAENVSFQAVFLASYATVYAKLLSRLGAGITQSSDIVFGIYLANRSHPLPGLPTLAAPTVNLVPLRIREALQVPVLEIAKSIQRDLHMIGSVENSRVGLWEVCDWTGVMIDCFVNFLTLPDLKAQEEDSTNVLNLGLERVAVDPGSKKYVAQMEMDRQWYRRNFRWSQENAVKDVYRVSFPTPFYFLISLSTFGLSLLYQLYLCDELITVRCVFCRSHLISKLRCGTALLTWASTIPVH